MTDIPPPICGYLGATVRADRITRPDRIRRQRIFAFDAALPCLFPGSA